MWWEILKTDRREAYNVFVEEFGPGVELREIDADEYPRLILRGGEAGTTNEPKFYLTMKDNKLDITASDFRTGQNGADEFFVIGLFEEEYPQRYKEIVDKFIEALQSYRDGGGPVDFQTILSLIKDKLTEQGIFNDPDYATVHYETFPTILLQAFEKTALITDYTKTATTNEEKVNLFHEVLDELSHEYRYLQLEVLNLDVEPSNIDIPSVADRRARRRESRRRQRIVMESISGIFIDTTQGDILFVPKKFVSPRIMMPLYQIIEEEMNPSGE
jgi:hypothetical protein